MRISDHLWTRLVKVSKIYLKKNEKFLNKVIFGRLKVDFLRELLIFLINILKVKYGINSNSLTKINLRKEKKRENIKKRRFSC